MNKLDKYAYFATHTNSQQQTSKPTQPTNAANKQKLRNQRKTKTNTPTAKMSLRSAEVLPGQQGNKHQRKQ
jgi:hypothetical protein